MAAHQQLFTARRKPDQYAMNQKIIVYGTTWCPDCRRAKRLLDQANADYEWINISNHDEARAQVEKLNNGYRSVPTIIFPDGDVLVEPSNAALTQKLERLA